MTVTEHENPAVKAVKVNASRTAEQMAAVGSMEALKASGAFDELMDQIDRGEIELEGKDGFIQQIIKAGLERGLKAELTEHLGYGKNAYAGRAVTNSRNGSGKGEGVRPNADRQGLHHYGMNTSNRCQRFFRRVTAGQTDPRAVAPGGSDLDNFLTAVFPAGGRLEASHRPRWFVWCRYRYHEMEVTMTDPKTLPESDPYRHTMQVRSRLTELAEHLREDVQKVDDPGFKILFETVADVLTGLEKAVGSYEEKIDKV